MMRFYLFFALLLFSQCQSVSGDEAFSIESPTIEASIFAPGVVSRQFNERDLALSPDGQLLLFTIGNHNHKKRALAFSHQVDEKKWTRPNLLPFTGQYNDIEPFFHPAAKQVFFASNRPLDQKDAVEDYNLWVVNYTDTSWGTPMPLPDLINSDSDEFYPSVAKNGNLYFTATYDNGVGKEDIFLSVYQNGNYTPPTPLDTMINSPTFEFNAYVSPNEDILLFSSFGRSDDLGGGDIYIIQKDSIGKWETARHLNPPINSIYLDFCPFLDQRTNTLYFTSQRPSKNGGRFTDIREMELFLTNPENGMGDIYHIKADVLNLR